MSSLSPSPCQGGSAGVPNCTPYGGAALDRAIASITSAEAGSRNSTLFREAVGIAELIAGGEIDLKIAVAELRFAAAQIGLSSDEISRTLASALRRGAQKPRRAPGRRGLYLPPRHQIIRECRQAFPGALQEDDAERVAAARRIWSRSEAPTPLVQTYLRNRGLQGVASPAIRALADTRNHPPAMIVAATDAHGVVTGIQRTILEVHSGRRAVGADGTKLPKISRGRLVGSAVRLVEPPTKRTLVIAEGVETALSFWILAGRPWGGYAIWATLGCTGLKNAPLPQKAYDLVIAADRDAAGLCAAEALRDRAGALGWTVHVAAPPISFGQGADWNDVLLEEKGAQ